MNGRAGCVVPRRQHLNIFIHPRIRGKRRGEYRVHGFILCTKAPVEMLYRDALLRDAETGSA